MRREPRSLVQAWLDGPDPLLGVVNNQRTKILPKFYAASTVP